VSPAAALGNRACGLEREVRAPGRYRKTHNNKEVVSFQRLKTADLRGLKQTRIKQSKVDDQ
jgi:hypothetical protein